MNHLLQLLKWDIVLFNRNRLFILAAVVAAIYIGLFYLLKPLGNLTTMVVVLIFNDPVITGYLFAAILLLFDKNQNTLQAISVLPLSFKKYLFSKIIILSVLATATSLLMAVATNGFNFSFWHLTFAAFTSAFIFSALGFAIGAVSKTFNQLLLFSIPFFIFSGVPLLALFGYAPAVYLFFLPSTGGLELLRGSFENQPFLTYMLSYLHLIVWAVISWWVAVKITAKNLV
jgi:hypothetical protein